MISQTFRFADGVTPNLLALGFTVLGYPLGVYLLTTAFWALNAIGFGLVLVGILISASNRTVLSFNKTGISTYCFLEFNSHFLNHKIFSTFPSSNLSLL